MNNLNQSRERIKVLIVDDEPICRRGINRYISDNPDVVVVGDCGNGQEAVKAIRKLTPDLVILDIQMPEMNGFEVIERVEKEHRPVVIFVTAYDQYAIKAFEAQAMDYVLKPIDKVRLQNTIQRAVIQIRRNNTADFIQHLRALPDAEKQNEPKEQSLFLDRLVIKDGGRIFFLEIKDIDRIESAENYIKLYVGRNCYWQRETMSSIERKLDPKGFVRAHRTQIVNLNAIVELRPLMQGRYTIILRNGTELVSGRGYRKNLEVLFNKSD